MRSSFTGRAQSPATLTKRQPNARQVSNGFASNGHASPTSNGHATHATSELESDGSSTSHTNGHTKKSSTSRRKKTTRALAKGKGKVVEKIDWEIPRKVFHSSIGFLTVGLYLSHTPPRIIIIALMGALAIIVPSDFLRFRYPSFARGWEACVGILMRESEKNRTNGTIWYILGVIFVLAVYPLDLAVVSILLLSWADTAASTFGRAFGRYTPPLPARIPVLGLPLAPRKSTAGFLAAFATGAGIVVGFWGFLAPRGVPNVGIETVRHLCWTWAGVGDSFTGGLGLRDFATLIGDNAVLTVESVTATVEAGAHAAGAAAQAAKAAMNVPSLETGGWIGLGITGLAAGLATAVAEALGIYSVSLVQNNGTHFAYQILAPWMTT
ncbi:hypothetical protein PUNSTDRAFT_57981 [Punctularia strigosozonata HHB-11173 SS5]|uniref:uncharacterized protein n=1 Tax=Punctularia strigosozonata (strain HHB-11173) TaxID=741275 RepID=UPI0004417A0B|nr:uncharacterized protein PUNSTDRAFT_57981 [Punctularia strigosozonata HHB-11173 SS5]EIN14225.1 hypothetical protein PUNSTDRAFT_57981 [Punctularia strigosozonata HHB-11173 SS5]